MNEPTGRRETILLLGNYRPSLAIARQLAGAGHIVIIGRCHPTSAEKSRAAAEVWQHPDMYANTRGFLSALNQYLESRQDISLILPISERCLLTLLQRRDKLRVPLAAASRELVTTCLDKGKMAQIAQELGVPQKPFTIADTHGALLTGAEEIGFPCVVRPNDNNFHDTKAYFIHCRRDLEQLFPVWPGKYKSLLLQAFASGPRYNRYFIAEGGNILRFQDTRTNRTDRADGSGYGVEGISCVPLEVLDEPCNKLVRHLNYTGIGCIQFLVDEQSRDVSFLEINPRLGGNYAFPLYCGLDQVTPLLCMASKEALTRWQAPFHYPAGRRYAWVYGDLMGLMSSIHSGEIGPWGAVRWLSRLCISAIRSDMHLTLDWRDLRPSGTYARRTLETSIALCWSALRRVLGTLKRLVRR